MGAQIKGSELEINDQVKLWEISMSNQMREGTESG